MGVQSILWYRGLVARSLVSVRTRQKNPLCDSSASVMAPGQGDTSMASCMETSWKTGDMNNVLAQLQESGSIHFYKSPTWSRDHNSKFGQDVQLVLPLYFIQEHGNKFEEYVIFRTRSSSKPWVVQVIISQEPHASLQVRFAGGWEEFVADNRLKEGDSLIFVLKVPLPEFEVYIFRGTGKSSSSRNWSNTDHCTRISEQTARNLSHGCRHEHQKNIRKTGDLLIQKRKVVQERQQNLGDSSSDSEYDGQAPSPVHQQDRQCSMTFTGYGVEQYSGAASEVLRGTERKVLASQHGTKLLPGFQKRLTATNIRKSPLSDTCTGRSEVPASFVKTHGMQLQSNVNLQGIHEDSPVQTVTCSWFEQGESLRLYFKAGWSSFVMKNGLHEGQELHFTLTAASFFVVRKV